MANRDDSVAFPDRFVIRHEGKAERDISPGEFPHLFYGLEEFHDTKIPVCRSVVKDKKPRRNAGRVHRIESCAGSADRSTVLPGLFVEQAVGHVRGDQLRDADHGIVQARVDVEGVHADFLHPGIVVCVKVGVETLLDVLELDQYVAQRRIDEELRRRGRGDDGVFHNLV